MDKNKEFRWQSAMLPEMLSPRTASTAEQFFEMPLPSTITTQQPLEQLLQSRLERNMAKRTHVKLVRMWKGYRAGREFVAMNSLTADVLIRNGIAIEVVPEKPKPKRKAKAKKSAD